jgi:hypothetical protein
MAALKPCQGQNGRFEDGTKARSVPLFPAIGAGLDGKDGKDGKDGIRAFLGEIY